jgi:hypothetical protein
MLRTLLGYAILAIVGLVAFRLILGLLGIAFQLLWAVLWLAALGFVFYLVLKVVSPRTAKRVRDTIKGPNAT